MTHTDEAIEEFRELYKAEFGKELLLQEAVEMTTRLINLYQLIYRPLPGEIESTTPPSADPHTPGAASPKA
jgi:hypothetical protein